MNSSVYNAAYFESSLAAWHRLSLPTFAAFLSTAVADTCPQPVLDLGCGVGTYGQILRQYGKAVVGCEGAAEAVTRARATGWYEQVLCLDLETVSAAQLGGPYALVFCTEVIEHLSDERRFCQLLAELVAPGGRLVLTTTTYHFYLFYYLLCAVPRQRDAYRRFLRGCWEDRAADQFVQALWSLTGGHYHGFRAGRLLERLIEGGFRIEHWRYANVQPVVPLAALADPRFQVGPRRWLTPVLAAFGRTINAACRRTNAYGANILVAARKEPACTRKKEEFFLTVEEKKSPVHVPPHVVYLTPTCRPYGGTRIIFQHAEGLQARGYRVTVVGPDPPPDWYPYQITYVQAPLDQPGAIPAADICVGTFWSTVEPAYRSRARHVFHLCQGFEGVHKEYASILERIDAAYRLPIPKILISAHLEPILIQRYGCRCYFLGQAVDSAVFTPGEYHAIANPLRVGVVGPFAVRSKGIPEVLRGLALARQVGYELEVHRASIDPLDETEAQLGVTDCFFHNLDTAGMVAFYRRLDVLFYSSYDEEGFPLPPLEAMACGVPVALTRIRPFAVLPDAAVLRYPPGDPEAVVPVIAALTDSARRKALREAGIACARTYTLDRVLDRLESAFRAEGAPVVTLIR